MSEPTKDGVAASEWSLIRRICWHVRLAGHAFLQRDWEDERVQMTVRERFPDGRKLGLR